MPHSHNHNCHSSFYHYFDSIPRAYGSHVAISYMRNPALRPGCVRCSIMNLKSLSNKTFIVDDFLSSSCLDFVFNRNMGCRRYLLIKAGPPGYTFLNKTGFSGLREGWCLFTKESKSTVSVSGAFKVFEFPSVFLLRHSLVS